MRKIYTLFILGFVLFVAGCKSASKLYEKGNYDEAVEVAVKKLQKKPDDEMRTLLRKAYAYAVNEHETRIRQTSLLANELKWEMMYDEYILLQNLHDAIHRSPEAMTIVNPIDYSTYLSTYADKAADVRFERGMLWMDKGDKASFRYAYEEFEAGLRYRPGDIDLIENKKEAYENAVIHVVVMPIDNYRYRYSSYSEPGVTSFESDLLRQLQNHSGNRFVRFYNSWEANSLGIRADQYVDFHFNSFNIGREREERSSREVSKEIVVKETVYRPDSVVKEYKKVFAKITTVKRTVYSSGDLEIIVRDNHGARLWSQNARGNHNWHTEFSTYTGDERALGDNDKELVNRPREFAPREDEIIRCVMNEINNDLSGNLRHYFSRL